jgi:hypothetical protein
MIDVILDQTNVVRGLLPDGTELTIKTMEEQINITYFNKESKPVQTYTIFRKTVQ